MNIMNLKKLQEEQKKLAEKITLQDGFTKVKYYGGIAQTVKGKDIISCIIVCDKSFTLIESHIISKEATFPYKPGFLAYREMPAMVEAFEQVNQKPDIILVNGHGILHPRRLGLASHFGLAIDTPTIGLAKKLLVGRVEKGKVYVGTEHRGFEIKTKEHANPLYISPGYHVSLGTALKTVQNCIQPPHKLPEPLHLAVKMVNRERKIHGR